MSGNVTSMDAGRSNRTPQSEARLQALIEEGTKPNWLARIGGTGFLLLMIYAAISFGLLGEQFVKGLPKLWSALSMMFPPTGWEYLPTFLWAMGETIAMAFLGTTLAAVVALPLAFIASRNTFPIRILQFGFRRFSDSLRALDYLIWALVFVRAVGLGPMAGILAIAVVDLGTLIKLYSEAIDNAERGPVEGVRAAGGSRIDEILYGVMPQVLPNIVSTALYIWESNTRSATILGIVGAGGIGYYLSDRLRVYEWGQASLIVMLIVAAVYAIDFISTWLRGRLIRG